MFVEPFASSSVIKMSFAAQMARLDKMCEEQKKLREEEEKNLEELKKIQVLANELCEKQKKALKKVEQPSAKNVPVPYWTYVPVTYVPFTYVLY